MKLLHETMPPRLRAGAAPFFENSFRMHPKSLPPLPAEPRPGRYRHYKGHEYRVIGVARHTETEEPLVVYEALYGDRGLWVRPAAMFNETVDVNGNRVPRFAEIVTE